MTMAHLFQGEENRGFRVGLPLLSCLLCSALSLPNRLFDTGSRQRNHHRPGKGTYLARPASES